MPASSTRSRSAHSRRRGFVLIAVLVIVVILTLAAYQFSALMMAEYTAADSYARSVQARALADSGIHYAAAALSNADNLANILGNNPYDNPSAFQGVIVQQNDKPRFQGRFTVVAARDPDDPSSAGSSYRFGVIDEGGKINLNALLKLDSSGQIAHNMLMLLPNMTEEIANAILDWIDDKTIEARPGGAKDEYYSTLSPPYRCKNGKLDSLEELLLVKGVTPPLLFGNDRNRNGVLDPDENDGSGTLDMGWAAYLTVYSRERNIDSEGNPRININDSDLTGLQAKLSPILGDDLTNFIIAYRMYGPAQQGGSSGGTGGGASGGAAGGTGGGATASASAAPQMMVVSKPLSGTDRTSARGQITGDLATSATRRARTAISSLFQLINATVSIPVTGGATGGTGSRGGTTGATQQTTISMPSPLSDPSQMQQYLPVLLDKVSTVADQELPPRINVNTASRTVLLTLPGLSEGDVQSIIDGRPGLTDGDSPDPIYQTPAWLIVEANLSPQTLQSLERYITARSQVYRVQALGHFDSGGPTARVEAVIDTNAGRPRIIYWRDLTELGKGFNLQSNQ